MIRVIYRWAVEHETRQDFVAEWRRLTEWIRVEFDGAHGSTLVEPVDEPGTLVGIARWASATHLASFRESVGPRQLPGAELISMEVLTELVHLTTED
jgi:heme-degrading monooxygenase HmoA